MPCPARGPTAFLQTVQRLLASAVADPSVTVRKTILEALSRTRALENHLAQAECLRSLFVALNDESSAVRALTIQLAGHICPANPAYVMPALRRHLMQLLSDMDHSPDSRQREGEAVGAPASARLMPAAEHEQRLPGRSLGRAPHPCTPGHNGTTRGVQWRCQGCALHGTLMAVSPEATCFCWQKHLCRHASALTALPCWLSRRECPAAGCPDPIGAQAGAALHRPRAASPGQQAAGGKQRGGGSSSLRRSGAAKHQERVTRCAKEACTRLTVVLCTPSIWQAACASTGVCWAMPLAHAAPHSPRDSPPAGRQGSPALLPLPLAPTPACRGWV